MPRRALEQLFEVAGLARPSADAVQFTGADPVYASRYQLGTATAAALAATGAAASELWHQRTGRRQRVAVDLRAAAASLRFARHCRIDGQQPRDPAGAISGFYPARDGRWVFIHGSYKHLAERAARVLGVAVDPAAVRVAVRDWDGETFEREVLAAGGCATLTRTPEEWASHPQALAVAATPLLQISKIGSSNPEPLPVGPTPLAGLRVLDVTRVVAGPTCGRTLAEHGPEVLKVSRQDLPNSGLAELAYGLGKRSTFLDLRVAAQADVMRRLVRESDVFVQSYRPGALAKLGFSPDQLAAIRPGLIYVTLSAWGTTGPFKDYRGYDSVVSSANGMAMMAAVDGQPKELPTRAMDYIAGYLMAFGAMVALSRRAREGGSWLVETSLAAAGRWVSELGLLSMQECLAACEPDANEIATLSMETLVDGIRVRHLSPAVRMSETSTGWNRPPSMLGADPPEWVAR